eukprot:TRINITY_DN11980_c0_g1_i2.p1 TRINITY_DN11980_c0_g1~~TRINITY_DN11980_c0_g1_i2.p1  ORF type:complete len:307 (+),score=29.91 TRINITY_DN11980_c0_g1_i2:36-956(+)
MLRAWGYLVVLYVFFSLVPHHHHHVHGVRVIDTDTPSLKKASPVLLAATNRIVNNTHILQPGVTNNIDILEEDNTVIAHISIPKLDALLDDASSLDYDIISLLVGPGGSTLPNVSADHVVISPTVDLRIVGSSSQNQSIWSTFSIFKQSIEIAFKATPNILLAYHNHTLCLGYWHASNGTWRCEDNNLFIRNGRLDPYRHVSFHRCIAPTHFVFHSVGRIVGVTSHFTTFAILGPVAPSPTKSSYVAPVPYTNVVIAISVVIIALFTIGSLAVRVIMHRRHKNWKLEDEARREEGDTHVVMERVDA